MIRKTSRRLIPAFAAATLIFAGCTDETPAPQKKPDQILAEIARKPPEPIPLSTGNYSTEIEVVSAKSLTEIQAGELLKAAVSQDQNRYARSIESVMFNQGSSASIQVNGLPTFVSPIKSKEGNWVSIKGPAGKIAISAKALEPTPDADGFITFHLKLERTDATGATITNEGDIPLRSGEVTLLSDTPELKSIMASVPNPMVMHIVPGTSAGDLSFIRVKVVFNAESNGPALPPPPLDNHAKDIHTDAIARLVYIVLPGTLPAGTKSTEINELIKIPSLSADPDFFTEFAKDHPQAKFIYTPPIELSNKGTASVSATAVFTTSPKPDTVTPITLSGNFGYSRFNDGSVDVSPDYSLSNNPTYFLFPKEFEALTGLKFIDGPSGIKTSITLKSGEKLNFGGQTGITPSGRFLATLVYLEVLSAAEAPKR